MSASKLRLVREHERRLDLTGALLILSFLLILAVQGARGVPEDLDVERLLRGPEGGPRGEQLRHWHERRPSAATVPEL